MKAPYISYVIPCLNESETITDCISACFNVFKEHALCGEIIVVDNGSSDGSDDIAQSCGATVILAPVKGYGAALHTGIMKAKGEYVFMADADMSYDFGDMPRFLAHALEHDLDVVIGSRFSKYGGGIAPGAMPWQNQYIGNPFLSGLARLLFGIDIDDFHCGARLIRTEAYRQIGVQMTGMEFATEMIVRAHKKCLKIGQVPIYLRLSGRKKFRSHLRPFRDGMRHILCMLQLL